MKCISSPCCVSSGNVNIHERSDNEESSVSKADSVRPILGSTRLSPAPTHEDGISAPEARSSLRQRISHCIDRTISRLSCVTGDNNNAEIEELVELTSPSSDVVNNRTIPDTDYKIYISEEMEESLRENFKIATILENCPFVLTFRIHSKALIEVICRDYMENQSRVREELVSLGIPSDRHIAVELSPLTKAAILEASTTEELQPININSPVAPLAIADSDTGLGSESDNEP